MIKVEGLTFSYTQQPFIKEMNFHVKKGEIFGFLGPSGAGKSTLQKILTGLIRNYQGSVRLADTECKNAHQDFYEQIGVDFEYSTLYEKLTAKQNLSFFQSLYKNQFVSIDQLLESIGLGQAKDKKVAAFSKGMKARLNFIKALLHDPEILFLDEPTNGLDPTNSQIMKEMILKEQQKGKTILLTTHDMFDAAELCDRVAFIVNGTIAALDSPHNLIMHRGATTISYTYLDSLGKEQEKTSVLETISHDQLLQELIQKNRLLSIHSSEPTLNDIFVEITGRTLI
ncbi:ABC transporter ATP-binding protein [Candidatus Enterococcus clewellii]|uniref:Fluoroquinolone transport system ATP-binding protein n=1 Tax=Candidatus Enterococcus clewellii TaxID=1834193 RepID=A0A242K4H7_9ENTE|nr:ABC transporter ATP-binding protein [Enterococcus sp. 9E7_DIV0242]OTP14428.1 hypothetical protein A5888_002529 [Enterococcus sp. 9E7_DIV0242]